VDAHRPICADSNRRVVQQAELQYGIVTGYRNGAAKSPSTDRGTSFALLLLNIFAAFREIICVVGSTAIAGGVLG
jgi:hypothetical protein